MPDDRSQTIRQMAMLFIWGDQIDPAAIAEACGWKDWHPQVMWRKGEQISTRNLDGTMYYSKDVYEFSALKLWPKKEWLGFTLEEQLDRWRDVLSRNASQLVQSRNGGASITLHCALLANGNYDVSADLQTELGNLGVSLGIEVAVFQTPDAAA